MRDVDVRADAVAWDRLLRFLEHINEHGLESLPPDDVRAVDAILPHRREAGNAQAALERFVDELTHKRGPAMRLRWGLDGDAPKPRAAVATCLGVPEYRVKQLEARALLDLAGWLLCPDDGENAPASFYTGDDPYGRSSADPIAVLGVDGQLSLMNSLVHEQTGEALLFHRRQSFTVAGRKPLDVYEVVTSLGTHWDELILDAYGPAGSQPSRPPPGYVFRRNLAPEHCPEPNRGDNLNHRDFPRTFLRSGEAPEHYRRRHRPKVRVG